MGLLAYRADGTPVVSIDLGEEEWRSCGRPGPGRLVLPGARLPALPRTSPQGYRFFAAPAGSSTPEIEDHLALKVQALVAARAAGWHATPEQRGLAPSGQHYQADVLCLHPNGVAAVAIVLLEQASVGIDYKFRYEAFAEAGMRGLWIDFGGRRHCDDQVLPSREVPRFKCRQRQAGRAGDYVVQVDRQWVPFPDFIAGALRRQLHFNDYTPRSRLLQLGIFRQECPACRRRYLPLAPQTLVQQGVEPSQLSGWVENLAAGATGICSRMDGATVPLHLGAGYPHCGTVQERGPHSRGGFPPDTDEYGVDPDVRLAITVPSGLSRQMYWSWGARPRPELIPPPGEFFILDGKSGDDDRLGQLLAAIGGVRW